jgi:uncharacterized protein YecT (DUF1311 family)
MLCVAAVILLAFNLGEMQVKAFECEAASTQGQIDATVEKELDEANRTLQEAYSKHLAALGTEDRERLIKSQRAWEIYRDAQCEAVYGMFAGGTVAGAQFIACKRQLTQERDSEIKQTYEEPHFPK